MAWTSGWVINEWTVDGPPCRMLNTPGGKPVLRNASARRDDVVGVFSDGLRITVFPVMSAYGMLHNGIMNGNENGDIVTQTP